MMNLEFIPQELENFKKSGNGNLTIKLEEFLNYVAHTGKPIYEWHMIKPVYRAKIESVLKTFSDEGPIGEINVPEAIKDFLDTFDNLQSTPISIQRLSELLINPRKEYSRMDKFLTGLAKNLVPSNCDA